MVVVSCREWTETSKHCPHSILPGDEQKSKTITYSLNMGWCSGGRGELTNGCIQNRKFLPCASCTRSQLHFKSKQHNGNEHVHLAPGNEASWTVSIASAKGPPTRAPLKFRVICETSGIEVTSIGAVDLGIEVHLPEGRENLPTRLQHLSSNGDLVCGNADGDRVDCQADNLVVK